MKCIFMKNHILEFHLEKMARVLGVCRSGFYAFLHRGQSIRERESQKLLQEIQLIHKASRCTYGSPRVHKKLQQQGNQCSRKRVARLMKQASIQAKMRKKWKTTTRSSKNSMIIAPNHLNQRFTTTAPNRNWVSDISYIETKEGWLYVAIVLDLFSRKIVGLSMGDRLHTELVTNALQQALYHRPIGKNLLHHSDRGCQYTSKEFREMTAQHGIVLSMSAKGRCYDNAVAESFFHTLKTEHVHLNYFLTRESAKTSIFEYIEVFYNRQRAHSSIGYLSQKEFERFWENKNMPSRSERAI